MAATRETMTTSEAATRLGITRQAVQKLLQGGILKGEQKADRIWGVFSDSVEQRLLKKPPKDREQTSWPPGGPITDDMRETLREVSREVVREEMMPFVKNELRETVSDFLNDPSETLAREDTASGPRTMTLQSKLEKPMDVKEAVRTAKQYIEDLYADEGIAQIGLEEVQFERLTNDWRITIGFVRPWDAMPSFAETSQMNQNRFLASARGERRQTRYYKVLLIDNLDGNVKSLTDRMLNDPH